MTHDSFAERRRALEEAFFANVDRDLLEKMRHRLEADAHKSALRAASGIQDEAVLERLAADKFQPESLAALSLLPLVHVAWADGQVQEEEREAILKAAHEKGVDQSSAASAMLADWLRHPPKPQIFDDWKAYVTALRPSMPAETYNSLKAEILRRSREVAESAGGFLGVAAVSAAEKAALHEIERALS